LSELERLIGRWRVEVVAPWAPDGGPEATATFAWVLGGAFVLQTSEVDHPDAPNGLCVLAPVGEGFTQHYFDSRGVVRIYQMTLDDRTWVLTRTTPDFTPLEFGQRYTGTFTEDGNRIDGRWEIAHSPDQWELDFELSYVRL
jgi:hypothetical protein